MTGAQRFRFGFSPCPNDTFAFWAAVHAQIGMRCALVPELADIETLNERAVNGVDPLPVTKLSLPALARCIDDYAILSSGAALGFGCGPLLVSRDESMQLRDLSRARVAIPGRHTTAFLLMSSLLPPAKNVIPMRFDEIMPAVTAGDCDAGLVIHEGRFTYANYGLHQLADLGELWEQETRGPLPLGVIAARRDLADEDFEAIECALRDSIQLARSDRDRPRAWIREHAQEMSDEVCDRHIHLYVNDFSEDLGDVGREAIDELLRRGRVAGLLPQGGSAFREAGA